MTIFTTLVALLVIIVPFFLYKLFYHDKPGHRKLPPGPKPLPIIGNFHLIGPLPHRDLAQLAQKYGPIMSIRLGQIQTIVLSSPKYAELVLKQYDSIFSGRPEIQAWPYGTKGMAFVPYGDYWRRVRLLCAQHLLSAAKIAEFEELRRREMVGMLRRVEEAAAAREVVNMDALLWELMENVVMVMIVGKGKEGENDIMFDLKGVVEDSLNLAAESNLADYISILRPFDFKGIARRSKAIRKRADEIFDRIIEDHLKEEDFQKNNDILGAILNLMNKKTDKLVSSFTKDDVKAIIFELFIGGIETSLLTIIWNLSSLLKYPSKLKTLQQELDTIIGKDRMVNESDLSNLPYLDMVVKETFRLYPVTPLLIPHVSLDDVVIDGYVIPKRSHFLVNSWAIGHDPNTWSENVEEFYPERFMSKEIDLKGNHFELLPFGSGRRRCPGWLLGLTSAKIVLAQLVHCFDWELPNDMKPNELDMSERYGLSTSRANTLFVLPSTRLQFPLE